MIDPDEHDPDSIDDFPPDAEMYADYLFREGGLE